MKANHKYAVGILLLGMIHLSFIIHTHIFAGLVMKKTRDVSNSEKSDSICLSPEWDSPWILNGTCMKNPHLSTFSSTGNRRSCGLCGVGAEYLRNLRDEIAKKYKKRCKDMVVCGAALGSKYESWMRSTDFLGDHSSKVFKRFGTCFFQFVTDEEETNDELSADGSQILIIIDPEKMPYNNNRRNTKIFKLNPGLLFPWAERVIWQDAKLLRSLKTRPSPNGLPSDYLLHFNRTVQRFGTCSSFMGLPHHVSAVGKAQSVSLEARCDTVVAAAEHRPSVSDNLDVLRIQCERYHEKHSVFSGQVFDEAPLVDSAFIVYDMRTPECRKFNGDLGCSWLDEIHCYSDRDQISFPHILASSGLKLSPELQVPGHEYRDRVYLDSKNVPLVHIAKRSCHWYYRSFSRCVAAEGEEAIRSNESSDYSPLVTLTNGLRVAVIVAGTLQRFMFKSTIEHVIRPMTRKGIIVDYYATLTTAKAKAYRSESGYADHFQPDPVLPQSVLPDNVDIEEYIRKQIGSNLTSIGALNIQERIDIDSEPMLKARREKALKDHPNEDPDLRFPLFDIRNEKISRRTANANRNFLRLQLSTKQLWERALQWEAEEGFKYDYVIFMRDDSLWLRNLNIRELVKKGGDIFIPACDARDPPMDSHEINDHIVISRRDVAGLFGDYCSKMMKFDMTKCINQLTDDLRENGKRGCNSEMLLKWMTEEQHLNVTKVGQGELPFQRSANVRLPDGSNMQCFHKFCQSESSPLILTGENEDIEMCKKVNWDEFYPSKEHW